MAAININEILGKLNELRAVFMLGHRAVPFIEEIFFFMKEVAPLLEEINASMTDTALKMPHATSQLQHISEATKTATTEILDLIDTVLVKSDIYDQGLDQTMEDARGLTEADDRLHQIIRAQVQDADALAEIEALIEEKAVLRHSIEGSVHARRTVIDEIKTEMNRIMMSLQVQDVTAQQIAGVTHLLESIRGRMSDLLERLDSQHARTSLSGQAFVASDDEPVDLHSDDSAWRQRHGGHVLGTTARGDGGPSLASPQDEDDDWTDEVYDFDEDDPGALSLTEMIEQNPEVEHIFRNAAVAMEIRRAERREKS